MPGGVFGFCGEIPGVTMLRATSFNGLKFLLLVSLQVSVYRFADQTFSIKSGLGFITPAM